MTGCRSCAARKTTALASLVSEAIYHTGQVTHEMHGLAYARDGGFEPDRAYQMAVEALACWQMADHYLRLLKDNLGDYDPWSDKPS